MPKQRFPVKNERWEWGKRAWYTRMIGSTEHEHMLGAVGRPYETRDRNTPSTTKDGLHRSWFAFPDYPIRNKQLGPFKTMRKAFAALGYKRQPRITGYPSRSIAKILRQSLPKPSISFRLPTGGKQLRAKRVRVELALPDGTKRSVGTFPTTTTIAQVRRAAKQIFARAWNPREWRRSR